MFFAMALAGTYRLTAQEAKSDAQEKTLRVGMIGLDTSHCPAFAKIMNKKDATGNLARMDVTVAFPGGSADIPSSRDRVPGYTKELQDLGVEMVDSIDALVSKVDAVLLESLDGRPHLQQALPVLKAKKLLYIDKPLAGSLSDAIAIDLLAKKYGAKWFSSSSLRFSPSIIKYRNDAAWKGKVMGALAWSPSPIEATHPDLFWYGVHGVETLYTVMGPGCKSVTRSYTDGNDVVTGTWSDGRVGTFRGIREGKADYGLLIFAKEQIEMGGKYEGYEPLVEEIGKFFVGGELPVSNAETIELFAFMQAAQVSRERNGAPVSIEEVMKTATIEAQKKIEGL